MRLTVPASARRLAVAAAMLAALLCTGVPSALADPGGTGGHAGNPFPPGQGYAPPPGHRAALDGVVPMWAPAAPQPPQWAPWVPVVWNSDLAAWGVWWNGAFIRL